MAPNAQPLGLDVGTSRIVVAKRQDRGFEYAAQLNAFVSLPYSKITETALKREGVPHSVQNGNLIVHGDESVRMAGLLGTEPRRPITRGLLNSGEAEGPELLRRIIQALAGPAAPGQRVYFSVPAAPAGAQADLTFDEAAVRQVLEDLGYTATSINEGLAVIYGELEDTNYSGIGVSCGGGLCNVALAYMSVPVATFAVSKGGDFLDSSAASVTGELANTIRIEKENAFHFNGHYASKLHQVLAVYYDDMIRSIIAGLKETLAGSKGLPNLHRAVPLVLTGGSAMPAGFRERFEKIYRASGVPLELSEIRVAQEPLYSTARGALIAALAEA